MPLRSPENRDIQSIPQRLEISVTSEKDLHRLTEWLTPLVGEEGAEQCVFALRSMVQEDYTNHCKDATQKFGQRLAEHFGGEESFFDLVPAATFSDVRSYDSLSKVGYRGDYHSVAMIELKPSQKQSASIFVDLTYYTVSNDAKKDGALILYAPGNAQQGLSVLENHYGGKWKIDFRLNVQTSTFTFQE